MKPLPLLPPLPPLKPAKGAAMLISVIILATIMLGFALSTTAAYLSEIKSLAALQNKKIAASAATACLEEAINSLGRNANYVGNETLVLGGTSCTIRPITFSSGIWTLETESQVGNSFARFRATLNQRVPPTVSSWQEIPSF